jgi:type IV fimbrial biogenesis protein FimT
MMLKYKVFPWAIRGEVGVLGAGAFILRFDLQSLSVFRRPLRLSEIPCRLSFFPKDELRNPVKSPMTSIKIQGFSFVEFIFAISISAIMIAVAMPSLNRFILNNRLTAQKNEFVLAMAYARSEAMKRGVRVSVCSRATDSACANSIIWDNGWLVFVDNNSDCIVNGANPADQVLQIRPSLEGNTLRSGTRPCLTFRSNGFTSAGNRDVFVLGDSRGAVSSAHICVSQLGKVTIPQTVKDPCPL